MLERRDRFFDEPALIENDAEMHRWIALVELRELGIDAVGDADHIGIGLSRDRDRSGRNAVEPVKDALLLNRIAHASDVAQEDGRAVVGGDDNRAHLLGRPEQRVGADAELVLADLHDAGGKVDVLFLDAFDDGFGGQPLDRECAGIGLDGDRALLAAADADAADPGDRRELIG